VLVQESGQHGGTASGPVVRDIIKAYYDKKNKNTGQTTVEYQHFNFDNGTNPAQAALAVNDAQSPVPAKRDAPKLGSAAAAAAMIPAPPATALRR
jgi:hypothetical protein